MTYYDNKIVSTACPVLNWSYAGKHQDIHAHLEALLFFDNNAENDEPTKIICPNYDDKTQDGKNCVLTRRARNEKGEFVEEVYYKGECLYKKWMKLR